MTGSLSHFSEIDLAIIKYVGRCDLLLDKAFLASERRRSEFRKWIGNRFQETVDPMLLLHDDPLYLVGRYLAMRPSQIEAAVVKRATQIAVDNHW